MDLIGRLVRLRAPSAADLPAKTALLADPQMVRLLTFNGRLLLPLTRLDHEDSHRERRPGCPEWAIDSLEEAAYLGEASLSQIDWQNRNCMFSVWLGPPDRWGRGYGTEVCYLVTDFAFRHLGMAKVWLGVFECNQGALRAYRKVGYQVEAVRRRHVFSEGRLVDDYVMACFPDTLTPPPPAEPPGRP